jgi:hypothetical protein
MEKALNQQFFEKSRDTVKQRTPAELKAAATKRDHVAEKAREHVLKTAEAKTIEV